MPVAETNESIQTASEILGKIRRSERSATSFVEESLSRAERSQALNALLAVDAPGALRKAKAIDALIASGRHLPPLAGLPIVVKDNINTRDLPTTAGTAGLRGFRPDQNAPVLQALLDAGAILIGKTNLHELSFGATSANGAPSTGPVRNPHNRSMIAGGSSGGTAAAIAAGVVSAGLGTDCSGSIRIPASLCGVVGFRPSVGNGCSDRRYGADGVFPVSWTRDTIGLMAHTAADIILFDDVIRQSPDRQQPKSRRIRLGRPECYWQAVHNEIDDLCSTALARLAEQGVEIVSIDIPELMQVNARCAGAIVGWEVFEAIPRYLRDNRVALSMHDLFGLVASPDVAAILNALKNMRSYDLYVHAIKVERPRLQHLLSTYFQENGIDALVSPTTPCPAMSVEDAINAAPVTILSGSEQIEMDPLSAYVRNTDPGSTAGIPGVSIPVGVTANGLPAGLSLDGPVGRDRRLLQIASILQEILGPDLVRPAHIGV